MEKVVEFKDLKTKNEYLLQSICDYELKIDKAKRRYQQIYKELSSKPSGASIFSANELDMMSPIRFGPSDNGILREIDDLESRLDEKKQHIDRVKRQKEDYYHYIEDYARLTKRYKDIRYELKSFDKQKLDKRMIKVKAILVDICKYEKMLKSLQGRRDEWKQTRKANRELLKDMPSYQRVIQNQRQSLKRLKDERERFSNDKENLTRNTSFIEYNYASSLDTEIQKLHTKSQLELELVAKTKSLRDVEKSLDKVNKEYESQCNETALFTQEYEETLNKLQALRKQSEDLEAEVTRKKEEFHNLGKEYFQKNMKRCQLKQEMCK